jgi:uncharacterized protein
MEFNCSGCGGCCVLAGRLGLMPANPITGACVHLTQDHTCVIYATRPTVCSIDAMYKERYHQMSKSEYYKASTLVCHQIIDTLQLDPSYKQDPTEYDT